MAVAGVDTQAGLGTTFTEAGGTALAIGVLCKETIAHVALTAHRDSAQAACYHPVQTPLVEDVVAPHVALVNKEVVVVPEDVALVNQATHIVGAHRVEVVLNLVGTSGVLAQGVSINIVESGGTEHVLHGLVVMTIIGREHKS